MTRPASVDERAQPDVSASRNEARAMWERALPVAGTLGEAYLMRRAVLGIGRHRLRFLRNCWNKEAQRALPALIAPISSLRSPGAIEGVYCTWLATSGLEADLEIPRGVLGNLEGCGVVLGDVNDAIVVAQGLESALSAGQAFGLPAVAALCVSGLRALVVPDNIRTLIIAFDHDRDGVAENAAKDLADRLQAEGKSVTLYAPPTGFCDWNDWGRFEQGEAFYRNCLGRAPSNRLSGQA